MSDDLKPLITVDGLVAGEIIKSKLASFAIPSILKFETAGRLLGITLNGLGKVTVMVNHRNLSRAMELIETHLGIDDHQDDPDGSG